MSATILDAAALARPSVGGACTLSFRAAPWTPTKAFLAALGWTKMSSLVPVPAAVT